MSNHIGPPLPNVRSHSVDIPPALPPRPPRRQGTDYVSPGRGEQPPPPAVPRRMSRPQGIGMSEYMSVNQVPPPRSQSLSVVGTASLLQQQQQQQGASGMYITTNDGNRLMNELKERRPYKEYPPLESQPWYWGNISKEDVTEVMKDRPDGSFLVRDAASSHGNYTLTLRKDGVNRLIRIMYRDGYYGFAEPLEFCSVVEMVEFYQTHSLQPYSSKLDITLQEAITRDYFNVDSDTSFGHDVPEPISLEQISRQLKETEQELRDKNNHYNELTDKFEKTTQEIQVMRLELSAQDQIIIMLKEHLQTSDKLQKETKQPEVKQQILINYNQLKRRFGTHEHCRNTLEAQLHRTETQKKSLDMERNLLKPLLKELQERKQHAMRFLNQQGYTPSDLLEEGGEDNPEDDLYATYAMLHTYRTNDADYKRISENIQKKKKKPPPPPPQSNPLTQTPPILNESRSPHRPLPHLPPLSIPPTFDNQSTLHQQSLIAAFNESDGTQLISMKQMHLPHLLPHYDKNSWTRDYISREESRDLLSGRQDGTFLVRPKPGVADQIPTQDPLHTHTIDIVDEGKFKRIPVFRGPGGGYGFAHPFEFDSLLSLVCYYATNTMQRHNDSLQNTMLAFPAFLKQ